MTIKQINEEITDAGLADSDRFLRRFLYLEPHVIDHLKSYEGLSTEIYLHHEPMELEQIKYAAIFSDFVSLYTGNSSTHESHLTWFDEKSEFYRERQLTIPPSLTSQIIPTKHGIIPGYVYHTTEDIRNAVTQYEPLMKAEKSILRPVRALLVNKPSADGKHYGEVFYADGNTPNEHWFVRDNFSRNSLPIQHFLTGDKSKTLLRLTLPYFRNIDLEKLSKILVEETDVLSPLRKSLKDVVINFDEKEKDIEEIRQDILRPQLDAVNRKFKNYKTAHKWGVAGSLATFAASLIQVHVPEANIAAFIASVITGAGVSGIFLSNRQYQNKVNELRDNPYFLLWRIQREPRL